MAEFEVSSEADEDLLSIALYTDRMWGRNQATAYAAQLERHFEALTRGGPQENAVLSTGVTFESPDASTTTCSSSVRGVVAC